MGQSDVIVHCLLDLLLTDAPESAFRELVEEARGGGATTAELKRLKQQLAKALQVRAVLEERRRRESELAALYETAGDLSSLRDLEKVLQAIVCRARTLLGSDAAYLTLIDEARQDTYMRVTDGIKTEAFKRVRLELGAGLGGLVAQKARPYSTPNYLADRRFTHTVDDEVAAEGLVAILGVPLKLGRQVIGVLFAANRHRRPFSRQEEALLGSLAAHAAIAIENARLFSETQDALRNLTAANAIIQANSEAVERAAAVHQRLTNLVLEGGGIADVAAAIADALGGSLLVVDPGGRLLNTAGEAPDDAGQAAVAQGALPSSGVGAAALRGALTAAQNSGRTVRAEMPRNLATRWVTPIVAGAEQLGALILARRRHLDDADQRRLERGGQVTALLLFHARSLAEAEHRVRGELLDDLLAVPQRDVAALRRRATFLGIDLDREHAVAAARSSSSDWRRTAAAEASMLAGGRGGLAGEYGGSVVVLLPDQEPEEAAAMMARRLAAVGIAATVGAAGPAAGPAALADAYRDAVRCQRVLLALGREGHWASPRDLGIYSVLFSHAGREELERFAEDRLRPVLEYDTARRTELVRTMEAFFAEGGNLGRAAASLHVHVNTLYQRLERIGRLLGPDWQQGDDALELHLALRIHRIAGQGPPAGLSEIV
jgi:DNA-binding PucR family transcriptional regulator